MNRYPSDEELNRLIEALEQQELYAPKNLKHQTLERARRDGILEEVSNAEALKAEVPKGGNRQEIPTDKKPGSSIHSGTRKSVQMFTYSFKVLAGMAAAIAMLIVLPMQDAAAGGRDRMASREQ
ncbi:MAG: hypothetical protein IJ409_10395, partial [Lachnospiraceae bacterium]|nr:hypothetical protein [Lachnospiraceae bacterium]